jgi:hypothetical protein
MGADAALDILERLPARGNWTDGRHPERQRPASLARRRPSVTVKRTAD